MDLDTEGLSYLLQQSLEKMIAKLVATPEDVDLLKEILTAAQLACSAPFLVDLWKVRNLYHQLLYSTYPELKKRAQEGDEAARAWLAQFVPLGQQLSMRVG